MKHKINWENVGEKFNSGMDFIDNLRGKNNPEQDQAPTAEEIVALQNQQTQKNEPSKKNNTLMWLGVGGGVLLLAIVAIVIIKK